METKIIKSKIGVDIDDVIFPLMENYLRFHNSRHGTNFKLENLSNYHLWKTGIHNSREESINEVLEFQNSPYYDAIDLMDGAKEVLEEISKNFEVYFVTSRPLKLKHKTESLLNKNFPKNGFNILYSGEIYGGNLSKAEICKAWKIPSIIEDNPDYATDCARNGIRVFLPDKPWNINCEKNENITRMKDLKEVLKLLK